MAFENCFLYTKQDVLNLSQSILHGYAIIDDSVLVNTSGLNEYISKKNKSPNPEEGRFFGIFLKENKAIIKTDIHGQEMIYLFKSGDDWAISNSFMMLSSYASSVKKINFYTPASLCFFLKNGTHLGEQLISHKTMIEEIELIPINCEIHVDLLSEKIEVISKSYSDIFFSSNDSYEDLIISMLSKSMSLFDCLSSSGQDMYISLSGGYDSRLVLGMLSRGLIDSGRLFIKSDIKRNEDYIIANKLCENFGLNINGHVNPRQNSNLSVSESYRMYSLSCGGTYLPIYPIRSHNINKHSMLRLTGDHSIGASFFSGKAIFNGDMIKVSNDIEKSLNGFNGADYALYDFKKTFDQLGVDINDEIAPIAYYSAIRSRHHCGRSWYKSNGGDYLMTPLMNKKFTQLGMLALTNKDKEKQLMADLFCAYGDWATQTPLNSSKGGLDKKCLENSKFKGGVKLDFVKYEMFGSFHKRETIDKSILASNIFSGFNDQDFKRLMAEEFYNIDKDLLNNSFDNDYIKLAINEIEVGGTLAHNYRRVTNIINTCNVKKLVLNSY